jgi:methyltransferase family protein
LAAAQPPNYLALLGQIHGHLQPRTYVEIGVALRGRSFARVRPETLAVGIDPILDRVNPRNRSAKLFAMESDAFFEAHDLAAVLEGQTLDLAFIDGMHLFEYALRDFMNLERFCGEHSAILVHDCYPRDAVAAARERNEVFWTGDVWKLIVCLKQYRPDLAVSVVDVPPSGLGVITHLDPSSSELRTRYDELLERFVDMDYAELERGAEDKLGIVANDWRVVRRVLPQPR